MPCLVLRLGLGDLFSSQGHRDVLLGMVFCMGLGDQFESKCHRVLLISARSGLLGGIGSSV